MLTWVLWTWFYLTSIVALFPLHNRIPTLDCGVKHRHIMTTSEILVPDASAPEDRGVESKWTRLYPQRRNEGDINKPKWMRSASESRSPWRSRTLRGGWERETDLYKDEMPAAHCEIHRNHAGRDPNDTYHFFLLGSAVWSRRIGGQWKLSRKCATLRHWTWTI